MTFHFFVEATPGIKDAECCPRGPERVKTRYRYSMLSNTDSSV